MSKQPKIDMAESILDILDALVVILDTDGRIIRFNHAAERVSGFKEAEVLGQYVWDAVVSDNNKGVVRAVFDQLVEGGLPNHFENSWTTRDGERRDIVWSNTAIMGLDGKIAQIIGTGIDVTNEHRMHQVIEDNRAELRLLNETSPDAIISTDELGDIQAFNKNAESMFGYDAREILGRSFTILFAKNSKDRQKHTIQRYLRQRFGRFFEKRYTFTARRQDGSTFPATLNISETLLDARPFFTAFVEDVTALRSAEAEVAELHAALTHASRLSDMGAMIASITHEVSQPLSAIINYAAAGQQLTAQNVPPDRISDVLKKIDEQASRVNSIIVNLSRFLRDGKLERKAVSLNEVVLQAIELSAINIGEGHISIRTNLDPELPCTWADEIQIHQVIHNILRNARRSAKKNDHGRVKVITRSALQADGMIELVIADNGTGIKPEIADHLFEAFKTTEPNGMGLGLSISKRIVEAHGGTLDLIGNGPSGATFRIQLPIYTDGGAEK